MCAFHPAHCVDKKADVCLLQLSADRHVESSFFPQTLASVESRLNTFSLSSRPAAAAAAVVAETQP